MCGAKPKIDILGPRSAKKQLSQTAGMFDFCALTGHSGLNPLMKDAIDTGRGICSPELCLFALKCSERRSSAQRCRT